MKFAIYPYKPGSKSAKNLADALECKQIKHEGSKFKKWGHPDWWVINWGSSHCPDGASVLNSAINVNRACNKLSFFDLIKDYARVPEYTTSMEVAKGWLEEGLAKMVVGRKTLTGHSGQGIELFKTAEEFSPCPLYTRYYPKDSEWRLHFIAGKDNPFYIQRKRRKSDLEGEPNFYVRNHLNGYIYAHSADEVGDIPADVFVQSMAAFQHSGLDFCGVDTIFNRNSNKAIVLEVNSACGLTGESVIRYRDMFNGLTKG